MMDSQSPEQPLIVHVVRQYKPNRGGLEDVVANLCRLLPGRGYRVRVVTCDRIFSAPQLGRLPEREIIDGVEVVRIPYTGSSRYPLAPDVFKHVRDADIIHVHAIDFFFDALSWGRFLHRRPMVVTTHGGFFHTPKFMAIKKLWFSTVTRFSALGYRKVIACSAKDAALFADIAGKRASLIENGVDTGKFHDLASAEPRRRIVTIGRFSSNKRLDRLLDTMRVLSARDNEWHLDIVGVPSDLGIADLGREIAGRRLDGRVTVHAGLDNADIGRILSQASIFASASEYEGFGLAAVEAMSAGLVPVLHGNEAYRDLAGRHDDIVITDFSEAATAADALQSAYRWLADAGRSLQISLLQAADDYAWETVVERYTDIYSAIPGIGARAVPRLEFGQAVHS